MKSNSYDTTLESQVAAVRGFSRFYTRKLGIIEPKLLHSTFTLQEARIIYELAHRENCTATDLVRDLDLDAGFVSRTLAALQRRQIVTRKPSPMPRNMAGTSATRRWSPRSAGSSSGIMIPRASIAGSRKPAASRSARSSW